MADNTPTFHHLNNSQSQRILWLLEELNIDYNLVLHERNPPTHPTAPFRSPPSLQAAGLYGKAPLLITGASDGTRTISESLAIANYLIRTFDHTDRFGLKNGDVIRDDVLTSMCMSNFSRATGFKMYLDFGFIKSGSMDIKEGLELRGLLTGLQSELVDRSEGGFFMGNEPGRADIMLEFPLSFVKGMEWADLPGEFPELDAWLQRVYDRPAWKRGLAKGFNGEYDMGLFPRHGRL